jgi:xanthine dehydrogenase YagR molybdenum-binding subunit
MTQVEIDTLLGKARVLRVAAGIAAGRVAAPELARSQCYGGVIQGIGYALYEQRHDDPQSGIVLSAGLEDYRIPGIGDTPEIEVHFDEEGFEHVRGGGVGMGELSTLAVAASIGNAVHNATGWRPYDLPIRPDRLLEGVSR